ncbi:MAG: HAD family hydrolase [Steroidobacteraceae bacterium]
MTTDIFRDVQCVLLDIDGTLVDSNEFHAKAWDESFQRLGYAVPLPVIRQQIGKGADQLIPSLLPQANEAQSKMIASGHDEIFRSRYLDDVRPFSRATDFVAYLHGRGIKAVLASSANRGEVDHYIDLLRIEDLIEASTCSDDVEHSKPAGDIFAAALQKAAGVRPDRALTIGDTPYDVTAASKCGIATLAVLSGGFAEPLLRSAGARWVYASVGEVLAVKGQC